MEDLTSTWNNLSLNEREGSGFTLHNRLRSLEYILVAKFLTGRVLNMEAVGRTFRQLWRSTKGFKIRKLEGHLVLFVFSNSSDVSWIIQSEPWRFDEHGDYTTQIAYKLLALSERNKKTNMLNK